jgi:NAD(P)-dependent dehydrogenase (short-subunit alcohol dehydrogenase family)
MATEKLALIVGAGAGLSAALARAFKADGMAVALAARTTENRDGERAYTCDATDSAQVEKLFSDIERDVGVPDVVVYNASFRTRGPFVDLNPDDVSRALAVTCFGGFLVGQAAARRMVARGSGSILFTGASASVKGYAQSAPFAMGKFALRGLAQSMARELHPLNVHVGHFVIDGSIRGREPDGRDSLLDADAIAASYLHFHHQPRSCWSWELEVRPWVEKF